VLCAGVPFAFEFRDLGEMRGVLEHLVCARDDHGERRRGSDDRINAGRPDRVTAHATVVPGSGWFPLHVNDKVCRSSRRLDPDHARVSRRGLVVNRAKLP
jgi:hypothetical protein